MRHRGTSRQQAWRTPGLLVGGALAATALLIAPATIARPPGPATFCEAYPEAPDCAAGEVACTTTDGQRKTLRSGEQLAYENGTWAKTRLTTQEAAARRQKSILLNGFSAPMETLPVLERELGISTPVSAR